MKTLVTMLLLAAVAPQAKADLKDETQPFTLQCAGSEGSVSFVSTPSKISYEIHALGQHLVGENQKYSEVGNLWEQAGGTYIEPLSSKEKWLSVILSKGEKVYDPGGVWVCAPTRNPDICYPVQTHPKTWKKSTEWIDLMVDLTKAGEVGFMSLDLGNKHYTKTLGANTHCTLEIQSQ